MKVHTEIQKWIDLFALRSPDEILRSCSQAGFYLYPLIEIQESTAEDIAEALAAGASAAGADKVQARKAAFEGLNRAKVEADQPSTHNSAPPPWPTPTPLPAQVTAAPPMDPDILPDRLRPWLLDVSEKALMPLEYVAIPAVVALGIVIGRKIGICPEKYEPQWIIPGNVWGAIVGDSGVKKSSAIRLGLAHLKPIEVGLQAEWSALGPSYEAQRIVLERRVRGGRGTPDPADIEDAIRELEKLPKGAKRIRTNDATVEKLGMILNDNPCGIGIVRDELSAWLKLMDKAGRENDRGFYLEGWGGNGRYVVDRVGRGTLVIPAVCLSVIGTIQPGPLAQYLEGAIGGGEGADGMIQRLQLLAWPDKRPAWRKVERYPDEGAAQVAEGVYRRLYQARPSALGAYPQLEGVSVPGVLFDEAGQAVYDAWQARFERRLESGEDAGRGALGSHLSKYRSLMPKLAMLLHVADHDDGSSIGEVATLRAAAWLQWLELHARKVYAPEEPKSMLSVRALAEKIQMGMLGDRFVARDVYRNHWTHLDTREAVADAIAKLCDLGWLRTEKVQGKTKPMTMVSINPAVEG